MSHGAQGGFAPAAGSPGSPAHGAPSAREAGHSAPGHHPGAGRPAERRAPLRRPPGQPPTAPMPWPARDAQANAQSQAPEGHEAYDVRAAARPVRAPHDRAGRERATVRERQQTPAPGRPARDRQHTPAPGRPIDSRRRLLRQRLVVFITVTIGVALAIAAAQGCENRSSQGLPAPRPAVGGQVPEGAGPALGLSADGVQSQQPAPQAPAARTSGGTGSPGAANPAGFGPATGAVPAVDWPNRSYSDPGGGPAIQLRDGRSAGPDVSPAVQPTAPQSPGAAPVTLASVLPARYRGAAATVVVLRRTEGSVPVDLVELFGFTTDTPVLLASRSSAADPQAAAAWRLEDGALVREERVAQTGASSSTRYTLRPDGTLDESWPGAGISGGTGVS
ncbi:hypothetical protein [Kitasatospora mediocidica]|uniref:hypothetical protein n=1 Tax=Kitasatospora mediocidica TaxID=58352 RepID=UPI0007C72F7B|nr:hypothetical protein [Kitasatospora mediocidica]